MIFPAFCNREHKPIVIVSGNVGLPVVNKLKFDLKTN